MSSAFLDVGSIDGVFVRRPTCNADGRGHLTEFFRRDEMEGGAFPEMGYLSVTNPGLSRGPHEHEDQTDIFFFPGPGDFLVALWDNRRKSNTFNSRIILEAGASSPAILIVPPGVVHAYGCISGEAGTVINIPNRLYRGEGKRGPVDEIRHEDDPADPFLIDFNRILKERRR